MKLRLDLDIDMEESALDEPRIKENIMEFARNLIIIGAEDLLIGLTVLKAECID